MAHIERAQFGNNNKFKLQSKYFNYHTTKKEQCLVNSLIKEAIHINGINMIYIPRKYVNLDTIYGEDVLSSFEKTFTMVFYVESSDSYQGAHSFLGTMGLDIQDQSKLIVSRDIFEEVVANSEDNDFGIKKPRNGDLIYNQTMDRIFEIVHVEEYQQFYQLGKQYTYALTVEFFDYSHETINTNLEEIDTKNEDFISKQYEITLKTSPVGSDPTYEIGEAVYIGLNLAVADFTAEVVSYNPDTRKVVVKSTYGLPVINVHLNGEESEASYEIKEFVPINFADVLKDNTELNVKANPIVVVDSEDDDFGYK